MSAPDGWAPLLDRLQPYVSPEWHRHANESGDQGWVRLILLVDAHHQLSTPRVSSAGASRFTHTGQLEGATPFAPVRPQWNMRSTSTTRRSPRW